MIMGGLGFSLAYFENMALFFFLAQILELRYMPWHMDKDG